MRTWTDNVKTEETPKLVFGKVRDAHLGVESASLALQTKTHSSPTSHQL